MDSEMYRRVRNSRVDEEVSRMKEYLWSIWDYAFDAGWEGGWEAGYEMAKEDLDRKEKNSGS
jgi:hypothetical protein